MQTIMCALPRLPDTLTLYPSAGALTAAHPADAFLAGANTLTRLVASMGGSTGWRFVQGFVPALLVRRLLRATPSEAGDAAASLWISAAADAWGVRAVTRALLEVRQAGVTARAMGHRPNASAAWGCLTQILGAYEEALESGHNYDSADRDRQAVLTAATGVLPPALQQVQKVHVACGTEVFGRHLDLLNGFASRGMQVSLAVAWDPTRPDAFAWPGAMLHALETRGHPTLEVTYDDRCGSGPLQFLRAAQFTATTVGPVPVELIEAPADADHLDHCIERVAAWVDAGAPLHQIAVVLPDMAGETTGFAGHTLAEALNAAGIAAQCREGPSVWDTPLGRGLALLVGLAHGSEHGFDGDDLAHAWRLWGTPIVTESGMFDVDDVASWLATTTVARLRGGQVAAALARTAGGRARHRVGRDIQAVAAAAAVEHFMARLAAWPARAPLSEHLACAKQWTHVLAGRAAHRVAAAAALQALDDLLQAAVQAADDTVWSRGEWVSWLSVLLQATPMPRPNATGAAIAILSPQEVVAQKFAHVLLVGANTGVFPRLAPPDPVLTDALRAEINMHFGPRLMQFAPFSGRGALPGDARDMWLWLEVLAACTTSLAVTVLCASGEQDTGQSDIVEALRQSCTLSLAPLQPSYTLRPQGTRPGWLRHAAFRAAASAGACETLAAQTPLSLCRAWESLRRRQDLERLYESGRAPPLTAGAQQAWRSFVQTYEHSASRLDSLGVCRYQHFAATGLHLQGRKAVQLGASPTLQGQTAHVALHIVYQALLHAGGLVAARLQPQAAWQTARDAFAAAQPALAAHAPLHAFLQPTLMLDTWHAVQAQLEFDLAHPRGEPIALEYTFGGGQANTPPALQLHVPAAQACLQVRGSIDRVDRDQQALHTLDYKRTMPEVPPGRHFQLGVYAAVALRDFAVAPATVHIAWRDLKKAARKDAAGKTPVVDAASFIASLQDALGQRLMPSLAGDIAPDPYDKKACKWCDFLALCRYAAPRLALDEPQQEADL